jgi:hypothetical protein
VPIDNDVSERDIKWVGLNWPCPGNELILFGDASLQDFISHLLYQLKLSRCNSMKRKSPKNAINVNKAESYHAQMYEQQSAFSRDIRKYGSSLRSTIGA